jgi:hypothetical protein
MSVHNLSNAVSVDVAASSASGTLIDRDLDPVGWYSISVEPNVEWKDAWKRCGAEGWEPWWFRPFAFLKQNRSGKWLALIATVDDCESFVVSDGESGRIVIQPGRPGRLRLYANDASFMYWNNSGTITVSVCRVESPRRRRP